MRMMKDSGIEWIGEMQPEWKTIRAKNVVTITNGSDPKTEGNTPVYGSGTGCFKTCGEFKEGPAVLLGRKGTIDNPQYVNGIYWNVDTAFDVKPIDHRIDLVYFYLLSQCFDYKYYTVTTTLPSMTQTNYGNMYLPYPSIDKQVHIVTYLKTKCAEIDALIVAKERNNSLLKERRQSIIYEAVTKGLNPDAPLKDSGVEWIGQIPENWSVYRLKYLLSQVKDSIKAGPFGSSLTSSDMQGNDVKVFNQRSVLDNDFEAGDEYVSVEKSLELKGFIAKEGDVLITTRGTIGKTTIVPRGKQGILHPCLIKMVIDDNVFLKTLLCRIFNETNMLTEQLRLASNATTIDVIYTQNLLNLYVPVPPIEEQEAIEKYLCKECGELDELISLNESSIQKLKEYRQSLIYEAVTGKMEV